MLVKIKTSVAGINFSYQGGQVVEVEEKTAIELLKAGHAEPAKKETETATVESLENAVKIQKKRR